MLCRRGVCLILSNTLLFSHYSKRLEVWLSSCLQFNGNSADSSGHPQDPVVWPDYRHAAQWTGRAPNENTIKIFALKSKNQRIFFLPEDFVKSITRWRFSQVLGLPPTWHLALQRQSPCEQSTVIWSAASRLWTACRRLWTIYTSMAAPTQM